MNVLAACYIWRKISTVQDITAPVTSSSLVSTSAILCVKENWRTSVQLEKWSASFRPRWLVLVEERNLSQAFLHFSAIQRWYLTCQRNEEMPSTCRHFITLRILEKKETTDSPKLSKTTTGQREGWTTLTNLCKHIQPSEKFKEANDCFGKLLSLPACNAAYVSHVIQNMRPEK